MTDTALPIAAPAPTESPFRRIVSEFAESKLAVFGLVVLAIFLAAALLAPWLAPQNPYDLAVLDILDARLPPGETSGTGLVFWLGSAGPGRDMLSAMLYGLRISLFVGVTAVSAALAIGDRKSKRLNYSH